MSSKDTAGSQFQLNDSNTTFREIFEDLFADTPKQQIETHRNWENAPKKELPVFVHECTSDRHLPGQ